MNLIVSGTTPGESALADLDFAVIDLETTGWSPDHGAITEIGAVRVRGGITSGEFASLVNPGVPVPPGIQELTGINDWLLASAPLLARVLTGLFHFADGCVLVAHNAPFDIGFLLAACAYARVPWPGFTALDTVMLARHVLAEEVPDRKLSTLAAHFRTRAAPAHRALPDARATAEVFHALVRRLTASGVRTLGQLAAIPDVVVDHGSIERARAAAAQARATADAATPPGVDAPVAPAAVAVAREAIAEDATAA